MPRADPTCRVATTVDVSPIAGRGLFTATSVPEGMEVIGFATSPHTLDDLGPLNHSCDPSLGWSADRSLVTVRDVGADVELTVDYATLLDDPAFAMACHCGTYRCRQLVEGGDWRIPQLQARYAGRWHPRVQALIAPLRPGG